MRKVERLEGDPKKKEKKKKTKLRSRVERAQMMLNDGKCNELQKPKC